MKFIHEAGILECMLHAEVQNTTETMDFDQLKSKNKIVSLVKHQQLLSTVCKDLVLLEGDVTQW